MSYILLLFICSKEDVCLEMDEPIPYFPKKSQGRFLNIYEDPDVEEPCMFEIGIYLSVFYCLFYVRDI